MKPTLLSAFVLFLGGSFACANFPAGANTFINAPDIQTDNDISDTFDVTTFTAEAQESGVDIFPAAHSAWWKWTAPADGFLTVETIPPNGTSTAAVSDTVVGVYLGTNVANLTVVGTNNNFPPGNLSRLTVAVTKNFSYRIKADTAGNSSPPGLICLSLRFYEPAARTHLGTFNLGNQPGDQVFINLATTATGSYSGKVRSLLKSYSFKGFVGHTRIATIGIPEAGLDGGATVEIDFAAGSGALPFRYVNEISSFTGRLRPVGKFTKEAPVSVAGAYSARVNLTPGTGYLIGRVTPTGRATFSGRTGDGVAFAFGSPLTNNGPDDFFAPFLVKLFRGKGLITGNVHLVEAGVLDNLDSQGVDFRYFRPPGPGPFLPLGITVTGTLSGKTYTPPAPGQRALGFLNGTNGAGTLSVGQINGEFAAFNEMVTLGTNNKFTFASATRRPVLKINPKNGMVSGTIEEPAGKKHRLTGVVASGPALGICGFVTGTATNASFTVTP